MSETTTAKTASKAKVLTNNTKGLRYVAGVRVFPGKDHAVELTDEQFKAVTDPKNKVVQAWIQRGDIEVK